MSPTMKNPTPATRKSISLSDELWRELADYRFAERITTESEALRRLIRAGLLAHKSSVAAKKKR